MRKVSIGGRRCLGTLTILKCKMGNTEFLALWEAEPEKLRAQCVAPGELRLTLRMMGH